MKSSRRRTRWDNDSSGEDIDYKSEYKRLKSEDEARRRDQEKKKLEYEKRKTTIALEELRKRDQERKNVEEAMRKAEDKRRMDELERRELWQKTENNFQLKIKNLYSSNYAR